MFEVRKKNKHLYNDTKNFVRFSCNDQLSCAKQLEKALTLFKDNDFYESPKCLEAATRTTSKWRE